MDRKEQIQRAKELLECCVLSESTCEAIKTDFPELAESEDERIRKELIRLLSKMTDGIVENYTPIPLRDFIAYLEKQNLQQSAEWSEEDEGQRSITISFLTTFAGMTNRLNDDGLISSPALQGCVDWLKSLRPQPSQKPSEEQMRALKKARDNMGCNLIERGFLGGLYNNLKELK